MRGRKKNFKIKPMKKNQLQNQINLWKKKNQTSKLVLYHETSLITKSIE